MDRFALRDHMLPGKDGAIEQEQAGRPANGVQPSLDAEAAARGKQMPAVIAFRALFDLPAGGKPAMRVPIGSKY
jgi:hypothetical protein